MKIIFIAIHMNDNAHAVPLGAAFPASYIKKQQPETEIEILEFYNSDSPEKIAQAAASQNADITAFSIYIWNRELAISSAALLKTLNTGTFTVAGGPEVTGAPESFDNSKFDLLISGEGEQALADLCKKPQDSTHSIAETLTDYANTKGRIIFSEAVKDLNSLPSPILDGTLSLKGRSGMLWQLSRGCPFKCSFCYESSGSKGVRYFDNSRLIKELELIRDAGIEQIFVLDPTFNSKKERTIELLQMFIETAPEIHYSLELRSEFINEETAELLSYLNCSVQVGLQTTNPEALKNINRSFNASKFKNKTAILEEYGITYGFDLIYGLPGDSYDKFLESINYTVNLRPNTLDVFQLAIIPGTELSKKTSELLIDYKQAPPYTVNSVPGFNEQDIKKSELIKKAANFFYNQAGAVTWLSSFLHTAGTTPSEFFIFAADFVPEDACNRYDTAEKTKQVIRELFKQKGLDKKLTALACDIISFFGYTHGLLEQVEVSNSAKTETPAVFFTYDCEELTYNIDCGITDLKQLQKETPVKKGNIVIYLTDGGFRIKRTN